MFPRQCLGYWRVTAFRWSSPTSPSCSSVLRGKGWLGVNVTFYLLIFHRLGGKWGARLVWKKTEGMRGERNAPGGRLWPEISARRAVLLLYTVVVVLKLKGVQPSNSKIWMGNLSRKCLVHFSPQLQKKVNRYYIFIEKIVRFLTPSNCQ